MTEEALFDLALNTPAADRAALLDRECANNPALRARVEGLLRADALPDPTLTHPGDRTASYSPPIGTAGVVVGGKYKLVEPIGEGGMGSVWLAHQTEPVKRKVAVKLIKAGMDSKAVIARFEAERQALAVMDHPNIAKILDGGLHDGRPYFVMELVKGVPITDFCDARKLTPRQRLELFVPVCQAIQHAHQKGIIHRDIKPSNVLVALYDDKPVPKVIDFGLAKATGGGLSDLSATGFGGVVGTPQYMSPEQASLNNLDIDTRSDIYSLGVLLYELLAGSPPFKTAELQRAGLMEMLRVVREDQPPRPSTKLSTAVALPSLSASRGTEPGKLTGLLRNELDWIVMKALEKDRARRYETANGFAADVNRYLDGEAVLAHPPSAAYRLRKFVKRHKGQVLAASLVLLALVAGVIGTTLGLFEACRQADIARGETEEKERQRGIAEAKHHEAVAAAEEERKAKVREGERAEGERTAKLEANAKQAEAERQKSRAEAGEKLANERLAQVKAEQKKAEEANQVAQKVRDFFQHKVLGPENLRKDLPEGQLLPGGIFAETAENPTLRELLVRAAKELAMDKIEASFPNQPVLQSEFLWSVGATYLQVGEIQLAIGFLERAGKIQKKHLGDDDAVTTNTLNFLASAYRRVNKLPEAIALWEHCYASRLKKYGPDDSGTLVMLHNLALGYVEAGELAKGVELMERAYAARVKKFGAEDPSTLMTLDHLASSYRAAGKWPEAIAAWEKLRDARGKLLGADHPSALQTQFHLGCTYLDAGKPEVALPMVTETLVKIRRGFPADSPQLAGILAKWSSSLLGARAYLEAEPVLRECLAIREKTQPDAWTTFNTHSQLGGALLGQKKYADAEPLLLKGYEGLKAREATLPEQGKIRTPEALDRLIESSIAVNKLDDVKRWRAERAKYLELAPVPRAKQ